MTVFLVRDETSRPQLAEQITDILQQLAPIMVETTGLSLAPRVTYRLVTPKEWRAVQVRGLQRALACDMADLDLPPERLAQAHASIKKARVMMLKAWPLVMGSTGRTAGEQPETVIAPKALHHTGLLANDDVLAQMVVHELVHHAQQTAWDHHAARWSTLFPDLRGRPHWAFSSLLEGHARWADQQVTRLAFGAPVDADRTRKSQSLRYRLHARLPGIRNAGPSRAAYDAGAQFIEHIVAAGGTDLINRIWKDSDLVPTHSEITDAEAWLLRVG